MTVNDSRYRACCIALSAVTILTLGACGGGGDADVKSAPSAVPAPLGETSATVVGATPIVAETATVRPLSAKVSATPDVAESAAVAVNSPAVSATVYYVDAIRGDDTWAGTAATPGGANGPWRTLSRLASMTLAPGDTVLLACGGVWNETIRFGGSGTAAAPIRIGAYPGYCSTPPAIDGRVAVPASAWQPYASGVYKVKLNPRAAMPSPTVTQVFENNVGVAVAHHPNQGFNAADPGSYYLSTAQPSATVVDTAGRSVSQYLVAGSDLTLPGGANITPDVSVTLRSSDWSVGTYAATSFSRPHLYFSPNSTYALSTAGWGYFLTGALWMLDSPGEWFYEASTTTLYVATSTKATPGDSITYSALGLGADLSGKSYVTVQGLAFRRVQRGIDISGSAGVQLQSVQVSQSGSYGVFAANAVDPVVSNSTLIDTLGDAILAFNASGLQAIGNDITNSGVRLRADGTAATLPAPVWGAIKAGPRAVIRDNRLNNLATGGIVVGDDSIVAGNAVQSFCLVLNDCGAIYTFGAARVTIQGNLLIDGRASTAGAPSSFVPHAVGIYLDLHTSSSRVTGNTVALADWGLQLLDAYDNSVSGNLFYGNRQNQIWLQQRSNSVNASLGDVFGNTVRDNRFFPTTGNASVNQTTATASAAGMATYDLNRYSTLISPTIATEGTSTGFGSYTLADWRAAVGPSGARGLDINGGIAAPLAGRAIGTIGDALITPGNLAIGTAPANGWGRGGSPAAPTLSLGGCPPGISACIRATAAASSSGLISSPKFPAVKDGWYRMSFDAAVSHASQSLSVVVRNAATYVSISPTLLTSGSTAWKRYSFLFKMTADAPMTSNTTGARIDFQKIQHGRWITLANLAVAPVTAAAGETPYAFIYNVARTPQFPACPVADATTCTSYFSFSDSTPVTWPARLDPLTAMVVFAPDARLVDSDNDGIADPQDMCPGTPAGAVVDNRGCPLGS